MLSLYFLKLNSAIHIFPLFCYTDIAKGPFSDDDQNMQASRVKWTGRHTLELLDLSLTSPLNPFPLACRPQERPSIQTTIKAFDDQGKCGHGSG